MQEKPCEKEGGNTLYDPVRECWVADTPEERVRQSVAHYLIHQLNYPPARMAHEFTIQVGQVTRRCDTVVFDATLRPLMVVEYKAPYVKLTDAVVRQVFNYNSVLQVPYIMITNGSSVAVYQVGYDGAPTLPFSSIPTYTDLLEKG